MNYECDIFHSKLSSPEEEDKDGVPVHENHGQDQRDDQLINMLERTLDNVYEQGVLFDKES